VSAPGRLDPSRLGLFGHSRGGAVALLGAARPEARDRLRALVTWAAVSHFDRLSADELRRWRETGTWVAVNARTGQELPVGLELLRDVEAHRDELDPRLAAARRAAPWLIVHGDRDETVPIAEGEALAAAAASPSEWLRVEGADHTFGAKTPFAGPNPLLIAAMNATQAFLLRHLRG
jgi:pimeloyl-ACP methyl ester carboxylesterase